MNRSIIVLTFLFLGIPDVISQTKNFIDQPYIETQAQVDTLIVPDEIYLDILITEKDTKGKTSVEELEKMMEATLKRLGIDTKEQLTLHDLASNFKKYFLRQQDVLKSKAYGLKVADAMTAGKVIIALEEIEISNVSLDRTEYSKMEQLRLLLKSKAILRARKQAEALAAPLGQKVGKAIYISDQGGYRPMQEQMRGKAQGLVTYGYSAEPIDIEFEKIKVETFVNAKFQLE